MKGALEKVEGTFKCERCANGVVNREAETGLNDVIERVESFMYLMNKFNAGGGRLSAVPARIRVGWMKLRELRDGIVWKEVVSEDVREGV